jgi:hypothetical protein
LLAPPRPSSPPGELDALIREARARQLRRRLGFAVAAAVLVGAGFSIEAVLSASRHGEQAGGRPAASLVKAGRSCGVQVVRTKILGRDGHVLYREPVPRTFGHQLRCVGSSLWVLFYNGVASSQEAYFGVHSGDGGRTWRSVFTERYFGMKAPHQLVTGYLGPWTLSGSTAYFTGLCVACGPLKEWLWVTSNGGRTFRRHPVPPPKATEPVVIRIRGRTVTITPRKIEVS